MVDNGTTAHYCGRDGDSIDAALSARYHDAECELARSLTEVRTVDGAHRGMRRG